MSQRCGRKANAMQWSAEPIYSRLPAGSRAAATRLAAAACFCRQVVEYLLRGRALRCSPTRLHRGRPRRRPPFRRRRRRRAAQDCDVTQRDAAGGARAQHLCACMVSHAECTHSGRRRDMSGGVSASKSDRPILFFILPCCRRVAYILGCVREETT